MQLMHQAVDEAGQTRRRSRRELTPTTLSFLARLSPEQRAKFVELMRQGSAARGGKTLPSRASLGEPRLPIASAADDCDDHSY